MKIRPDHIDFAAFFPNQGKKRTCRRKGLQAISQPMKSRLAICPCCGQPIVPEGLSLPPIKQKILETVQRCPGISAGELRGVVWAADPNGGPEDRKVLHVHVYQLNQRLAPSA